MLKRFYAHNYKTLVNFEWRPPAVSVLVGPNGAGKSALAGALCAVQDLVWLGAPVQDLGFPGSRTAWLNEPVQVIEIEVEADVTADVDGQPFAAEAFRYRLELNVEGKRLSLGEELYAGGDLLYRTRDGNVEVYGDQPASAARAAFAFDRRRSFLAVLEPRRDNRRITAFREFIKKMWVIQPDPPRMVGTAREEDEWLDRTLSNFAGWYRSRVQEDPDGVEGTRKVLRDVLPGFDALQFGQGTGTRELLVQMAFGEKKKPFRLGFEALSEGQRMLVALYALLHLGARHFGLVVLDEVENYVAPGEIQPWFRALLDTLRERNSQLIAISHHPEPIDYIAADSAWRMTRDPAAGHTRIEKLEPDLDAGQRAYELVRDLPPEA